MRHFFGNFLAGRAAVGLFVLRVVVGAAFAIHGWGKIQSPGGMFGWGTQMGIPPFFQFLAAVAEFAGGLGLVVGLLTPIAAFGIVCTMAVAYYKVGLGKPFVAMPGTPSFELIAVYFACAFAVLMTGPGAISLDALLIGRLRRGETAPPDATII